jgi:hypothetical protein
MRKKAIRFPAVDSVEVDSLMKVLGLKKEILLIKQKWATISPAQPTYAPAPQMIAETTAGA